jgi:hypothetical protein
MNMQYETYPRIGEKYSYNGYTVELLDITPDGHRGYVTTEAKDAFPKIFIRHAGWCGCLSGYVELSDLREIEEADFAKHPAAVAYMEEHADYMADKQLQDELRGGL